MRLLGRLSKGLRFGLLLTGILLPLILDRAYTLPSEIEVEVSFFVEQYRSTEEGSRAILASFIALSDESTQVYSKEGELLYDIPFPERCRDVGISIMLPNVNSLAIGYTFPEHCLGVEVSGLVIYDLVRDGYSVRTHGQEDGRSILDLTWSSYGEGVLYITEYPYLVEISIDGSMRQILLPHGDYRKVSAGFGRTFVLMDDSTIYDVVTGETVHVGDGIYSDIQATLEGVTVINTAGTFTELVLN